jgi:glycogen debranching enzyme
MEGEHPEYPVGASAQLADVGTRSLQHGDTFLVCDRRGDLHGQGHRQLGLYHRGTRHLSHLRLHLEAQRMLLLRSTVRHDNVLLAVELMNPDLRAHDGSELEHGALHLRRERFLFGATMHEHIELVSFANRAVPLALTLELGADFVDLFEVRGTDRERRGQASPPEETEREVRFVYQGLDGVRRTTTVRFDRPVRRLGRGRYQLELELPPREGQTVRFAVECASSEVPTAEPVPRDEALARIANEHRGHEAQACSLESSNERFDAWVQRSDADLRMLFAQTPHGLYPYGGVPWYSTPFGRDGILTALEQLWVRPSLAASVLDFLVAHQARTEDPSADAEPGKIVHEMRHGEMAALGEVPFGRYYGTVDATPLFVVLAGRYYRATGDEARIRRIWPAIEAALGWIDRYGDADGDGFVEYGRKSARGLEQQGWKDSNDSVFHADGRMAEGPIALAEVQAYVHAAREEAATMALALGHPERARVLRQQAAALREAFDRAFFCERLGTYALALDGQKRPCEVVTSNAGHCLFGGIATPERALRVAASVISAPMLSRWGVRTVASTEARYNPMSYHNGSIWPHDNAVVARGLARYGYRREALRILSCMFAVAMAVELHRLPELWCGFDGRSGEGPSLYPVACAPQAWAAGAVFLLLEAALGLEIDGLRGRVTFDRPQLPEWLEVLRVRDLVVGDDRVDFTLRRHPEDVSLTVEGRTGPVEVVVVK